MRLAGMNRGVPVKQKYVKGVGLPARQVWHTQYTYASLQEEDTFM